ncbi:MAG: 50S ribosome-binding GTPase [Gammaproteobacteria bacterium]|nr:50S ribosome-binding GTPase [Gammaproteobacteria bacterium]MBU1656222.1 50S ribosome-binding GTPase [Gammaproteobacteria bacterium]MBU1959787.1 50S ribosome-binding GTPase [Gammaproteobacteria bacterium]
MNSIAMETLLTFIVHLQAGFREQKGQGLERQSLLLAEGLLRKGLLRGETDETPLQVVIIGPTQVGKSTLVNLLLDGDYAGVSALAGYTRHAQGFCLPSLAEAMARTTAKLLPHMERAAPERLTPDRFDRYSLTEAGAAGALGIEQPLILWDTPDFDSVSSRDYRFTVPLFCALADLLVLVVSKEKYADRTVWELLRLLSPAGIQLLVVLNKIDEESRPHLVAALQLKFEQEGMACPVIQPIPYVTEADWGSMGASEAVVQLRSGFLGELTRSPSNSPPLLKPLLDLHWPLWTAPVRREQESACHWEDAVEKMLAAAGEYFERSYLRNPDYRETLDRAVVQLLGLLEVPGLAVPMARARHLLTWPARRLGRWLRTVPRDDTEESSSEVLVLGEAIDQLLLRLQRIAGERAGEGAPEDRLWWHHLWRHLHDREAVLRAAGAELIAGHRAAFLPEIEAAARSLYRHLEDHPALLNSLRVARVTADAAAVILALKTGGIGLNDLLLTPAMLSFTAMLTEGAVGQYMHGVERELKRAQAASVKTHLLQPLAQLLADAPREMPRAGLFSITSEELARAESALEELSP